MPWWVVLIIVAAVLVVGFLILRKWVKKQEAKREESQMQMEANKQYCTMLVIDKKKLPLKDSGLPAQVIASTPKRMRRMKLPIVKAKVGAKVMTLIAEQDLFDYIPVKKEIKAAVSGLYILEIKGIRGALVSDKPKKKDGFFGRLLKKGRGEL